MDASYALLICNGEQPPSVALRELATRAAYIVCADGGANVARRLGLEPDIIIGDFDSMTRETRLHYEREGTRMEYLNRQTDTDFEKALLHLRERGTTTIALSGVTGGLLDHTLGNMSIILRYVRDFRLVLFDPHYRIDVVTAASSFSCRKGDRVSIVPLAPSTGVRYDGLRYQFEGAVLSNGIAEGTCNEALGKEFTVHLDEGALLVFRRYHEEMVEL